MMIGPLKRVRNPLGSSLAKKRVSDSDFLDAEHFLAEHADDFDGNIAGF